MTQRIKLTGRASFVHLNVPTKFNEEATTKSYNMTLLIPKDDEAQMAVIKKAMREVAVAKWGAEKADAMLRQLMSGNRTALQDGDNVSYAGFEGHWGLRTSAKEAEPPTLVYSDGSKNVRIPNEQNIKIYSGCYVNILGNFWAQDNKYGKRLNFSLAGVQFVSDGDRMGGAAPAREDDFEVIEAAHTEDDDFGAPNQNSSNSDLF